MKTLKIMSMLFIISALCFGLTSCGPDDEPVKPIDNPSNTTNTNTDNPSNDNTDNPSNTDNIDYSQVIPGHWKNTDVNEDDYEVTLSINYNGTGTICYYDLINDDYQYGVMAWGTYSLSGKILTATFDRVEVRDAYYEPFTYHGFSDGKSKTVVYTIQSCDGKKLVIKDESGNTSNYEKYGDIEEFVPSLSVSTTSLSFVFATSSKTIDVTANGEYTYFTNASWLTITQNSDKTTLMVSVEANTGTTDRTATITLTLGSLTRTISVTQEAAANTSDDERTFTVSGNGKTVTFKMIKVEGGTFQMGSTTGESDEQPVHSVTISKAYYMCETEVTQALWYAVMGQSPTSGGSSWSSSLGIGDNYPAYYINYEDCQSFLTALNSKLSSQLGSGEQFRFPTEAEWEFAAKGGNKSKGYTYAGSNTIDDVAWYNNNSSSSTHQIKTKAANELGLYDMTGNVWEWCEDRYGSYSTGAQTDPTGAASGSNRVYRGGSWGSIAGFCRVSDRRYVTPGNRYGSLGLRLAL